MTHIWLYALISVFIVSLTSLLGILTVALKQYYLKGFLLVLVSFSAGALLGDVFFHLLPELVAEEGFSIMTGVNILLGILIFFILEKIVHWHHCHIADSSDHTHPLAVMNLVGDAVHNFIDGTLIAGSYLLSIPVGVATTVAVIFHEIPQEMGDFGVLLHSGMKVKKALFFNFLSASFSILGVLFVLALSIDVHTVVNVIIPITAGGFLYIANSDLIPELHKDVKVSSSIMQLVGFLIGAGLMLVMLSLPGYESAHGNADDETKSYSEEYMEDVMNDYEHSVESGYHGYAE